MKTALMDIGGLILTIEIRSLNNHNSKVEINLIITRDSEFPITKYFTWLILMRI